jgi:hypothetical protein
MEVNLIQQPVPLILLLLLSLGHVCSFGSSTTVWPITQTLGQVQVTKNRSTFSTDDAIFKTLYLAIRNASEKWTMPIKHWGLALNQFAIEFGKERVPF